MLVRQVLMADSSARLAKESEPEPDALRRLACPMCHTPTPMAQANAAGVDWRCARCGQHWDDQRLAAVAAYADWTESRTSS